MSIDITRFLQAIETETVTIRGQELKLRALKAQEVLQVDTLWLPPMAIDEAEKKHPKFRALNTAHYAKRTAILVGIAADISAADGSGFGAGCDAKWLDAYADHVLAWLTEQEILTLHRRVQALGEGVAKTAEQRIGTELKPGN